MKRNHIYVAVLAALAAAGADARITKVTIDSRATAFGGYAWPGVGQYEKITGWAFGELDPNDAHNAVITDIELAPRNANGKVEYSHNFYILKPLEPGERQSQGRVRRGQPRVEDLQRPQPGLERRRSRLGDRRAGAVAVVPVSERLFIRGQRMGRFGRHEPREQRADRQASRPRRIRTAARSPAPTTCTSCPAARRWSSTIRRPRSTSRRRSSRTACISTTRRKRCRRPAGTTTRTARRSASSAATSSTTTSTSSATSPKDPTVNGIGFAAIRDFMTWLRYESEGRLHRSPIRWPATSTGSTRSRGRSRRAC